jgi:hypothetical protein
MNAFNIPFVLSGLSSVLGFTSLENMLRVVMVVRVILRGCMANWRPNTYDVIVYPLQDLYKTL